MDGQPNDPRRQLSAAWQAATAALGEWRQQVSAATSDAKGKLDPALRAAVEAARAAVTGDWRACRCSCPTAPPGGQGGFDGQAVLTTRVGAAGAPPGAPRPPAPGGAGFAPS